MELIEREITNIDEIEALLSEAHVCRVALHDGDYPYIVPMRFGYSLEGGELELYFRCAEQGKKIDLLKANNKCAFEIDEQCGGESAENYRSITGFGTVEFINGIDKITGLGNIFKKYSELPADKKLHETELNSFAVLKLTAAEFCCKEHTHS